MGRTVGAFVLASKLLHPRPKEVVQLSEQSNQRVSIWVARPEARRACESLVPFTKLPTPIRYIRSER